MKKLWINLKSEQKMFLLKDKKKDVKMLLAAIKVLTGKTFKALNVCINIKL